MRRVSAGSQWGLSMSCMLSPRLPPCPSTASPCLLTHEVLDVGCSFLLQTAGVTALWWLVYEEKPHVHWWVRFCFSSALVEERGYCSDFAGFTAHDYWYKHILVWLQIVWPEVPVSIMIILHTRVLAFSNLSQSRLSLTKESKKQIVLAVHTQRSLHFNIPRSK